MQQTLQEITNTLRREIRIDRDAGILFGVKIIGCQSRNGRDYPNETLREAIDLYENSKVNLDHPDGDPRKPRSYQDRFGMIRNVMLRENDGLYADFRFNPKHAVAEQLLWDAQNAPENVGFSHNVEALVRQEEDRTIVEKIVAVRSVDLVADPATTAGLFETVQITAERSEHDGEKIQSLLGLCKALVEELHPHIPSLKTILDDSFLEMIAENADQQTSVRLIEDRLKLIAAFRCDNIVEAKPISREQYMPEKPFNTKSFAKLLKL